MRVLIDTNIVLDYLLERELFLEDTDLLCRFTGFRGDRDSRHARLFRFSDICAVGASAIGAIGIS